MLRENALLVVQNHFDFCGKNLENSLVVPTEGVHRQPARDLGYRSRGLLVQESVNKQWS